MATRARQTSSATAGKKTSGQTRASGAKKTGGSKKKASEKKTSQLNGPKETLRSKKGTLEALGPSGKTQGAKGGSRVATASKGPKLKKGTAAKSASRGTKPKMR